MNPGDPGSGHYYRGGQPSGPWVPAGRPEFARITDGFKYVKQALGPWILGLIIYFVISQVMGLIAQQVAVTVMGRSPQTLQSEDLPQFFALIWLQFVLGMAGAVVVAPIFAGLYAIALQLLRGQEAQIDTLFKGYSRFADIAIVYLASTFLMWIGFLLCIIPGLVIGACLAPAYLFVMDRGMTGMEAIRASWRMTSPHLLSATAYFFFAGLLAVAGFLLCGVGILFTFPILFLSITALYLDLNGPEAKAA
ncbi:MAG: hypothetical protein ACK4XJ_05610 [Fimbriimonadaceae bacterium]